MLTSEVAHVDIAAKIAARMAYVYGKRRAGNARMSILAASPKHGVASVSWRMVMAASMTYVYQQTNGVNANESTSENKISQRA